VSILLRVVVNVVINVVIVFIAVVITIKAFFVIKAIKAFRLIFFTTRIIFTEQLLRSAWERHHYYRSRRTLREKKNKRGKGVSRLFNNI
jgi:ABC-type transport system involved in cytochrome bd biosynthesis fused ATPase/permease subunit